MFLIYGREDPQAPPSPPTHFSHAFLAREHNDTLDCMNSGVALEEVPFPACFSFCAHAASVLPAGVSAGFQCSAGVLISEVECVRVGGIAAYGLVVCLRYSAGSLLHAVE